MEDVWYFAPRLQEFWPYDLVICLIWTSPFTGTRNQDWSDDVSKPKFKNFENTDLNFIKFQILLVKRIQHLCGDFVNIMPYPCCHFYFDIKFGNRLYSKEKIRAWPLLF